MAAALGNQLGLRGSAGTDVPAKTKPDVTKESKPDAIKEDRTYDLAKLFIWFVFAILAVLVIGSMAVIYKNPTKIIAFQHTKDLLGILLPVLGTWAGTILAFYFTKENFAAASKSSIDLQKALNPVQEKLTSIKATDTMIDISEATKFTLPESAGETKLKELLKEFDGKERLPMLDDQGRVKYVAHRSLIDRFIVKHLGDDAEHTLGVLVKESEMVLTGFGVLSKTATLAEAKALMDNNKDCLDVFVTEDGTKTGKAIGWVTNVIVQEQAQL